MWKTIGIWMDLHKCKKVTFDSAFVMITTSEAPINSAAYFLKSSSRKLDAAIQKLTQTAQTSTNKETKTIREKFLKLSDDNRKELLQNAYIIDCVPQCDDIEQDLQRELWTACPRNKLGIFLSYLEGWLFQRVLKSLSNDDLRSILGE